ncbi:GrpB family protein [Halobacillus shinanisalinarum]|uniref:GrpB family protein n=1 Tax=Halobacillus shinanisalinarum TaxID=2932258 RepID=A0ABY4H6Y7_9BACI|nr:GrpB family protein [Halobacillus shinanisalinarum]UOQ95342.1 GrpB family protein [Halobacillus shinanisalinarum]
MRKVEVISYQKQWSLEFKQEANVLNQIFNQEIVHIDHIGSTAVEGLKAKPVIDIMAVCKDIHSIDTYNEAMAEIGYVAKGENGLPGRRFFEKGGYQRTHHVHVYQKGDSEVARHLAFRDYLRTHPKEVTRYGGVKEDLARRFPYDIKSYIVKKNGIVKEIEHKALMWYDTAIRD